MEQKSKQEILYAELEKSKCLIDDDKPIFEAMDIWAKQCLELASKQWVGNTETGTCEVGYDTGSGSSNLCTVDEFYDHIHQNNSTSKAR